LYVYFYAFLLATIQKTLQKSQVSWKRKRRVLEEVWIAWWWDAFWCRQTCNRWFDLSVYWCVVYKSHMCHLNFVL